GISRSRTYSCTCAAMAFVHCSVWVTPSAARRTQPARHRSPLVNRGATRFPGRRGPPADAQPTHTGSRHGVSTTGVRRAMHHSRHARDRSSQLEFEDVITVEL